MFIPGEGDLQGGEGLEDSRRLDSPSLYVYLPVPWALCPPEGQDNCPAMAATPTLGKPAAPPAGGSLRLRSAPMWRRRKGGTKELPIFFLPGMSIFSKRMARVAKR
jgi:hypothetical protein